ncbi:hypothetical protein [Pseudonocardia sp. N23]|uniref:hypothetical protein n=1 Tax=Pseudonocardia sp. N23 TaxID=1987376 RepID=UPI000BFCE902|nr:hypothetical protein [Pseudonocardia sp. N23]
MPDFQRLWAEQAARAHEENQARRDRVLAHEDLAKALTQPPYAISDPRRWSGWIPPRTDPPQVCGPSCGKHHNPCNWTQHRARINDSPIRAQLVEIAAEALRRETQPALDEVEP